GSSRYAETRSVENSRARLPRLIEPNGSLATVGPRDLEVSFHFVQMRIPFRIKPHTHGIGGAEKLAIDDLQSAGVACVSGAIAHVEVRVDSGQRAAQFTRNAARLLGNQAHRQDSVLRMSREEAQILPTTVDLQHMNGPRFAFDLDVH